MKVISNNDLEKVNGSGPTSHTEEQIIRNGGCVYIRN